MTTEKTTVDFKVIGKTVEKVDGRALVTGKPVYTNDFDVPGALFVKIVRSPHAHALIKEIDTSSALEIPGVVKILTHNDLPRIPFTRAGQGYPEPSPYDTFILDKKVRFVGDAVAIVAAETERAAVLAMKAVKVEYEVLEPVLSLEDVMKEGAPIIHDEEDSRGIAEPGKNIAAKFEMQLGNIEESLEKCDKVMTRTYRANTQHHGMLEPHTAVSYFDSDERLTVIVSTQVPFHSRRILSRVLEIPMSRVRVIKPRIGGGFGGKQAVLAELYTSAVTLKTGRPARIVFDRSEVSMASNIRHEMIYEVTVGAMNDGTIKVLSMEGISNTGAYGEHSLTTFMVAGSKTLPLYNKVDAVRFAGNVYYTNLPSAGAYRGYGAPQGLFALDCTIDELAVEMGIDPLKMKEMNTIREGETSPIFKVMGEGREGVAQIMNSCKLQECIDLGKEKFHWDAKVGKREKHGNKVRGVGCALAMQGSGIAKIDMGAATIKMNEDGSFNLLLGATDLGTGSDTIMAQIVAETLEVPVEKVIVYSSDTDRTPFDVGAYASSTTYVSGNAVKKAAEMIKEQILEKAGTYLEEPVANLHLENKKIVSITAGKEVSYKQLCEKIFYTFDQKQIAATASYVGEESPAPFMASFAEVEVDLDTGKVSLINYVSYADCGTALNPLQAKGQLEGAAMQGIGWALYEDILYSSSGRMLNSDFFTYKMPSRLDYGILDCELVESYEPSGPYGAKSIGEIGIDTPIPAISNAIFDAVGVRLRVAPFRSENLFFEILKKDE